MSTLYLDHQMTSLKLEGEVLVVFIASERQSAIPLKLLERVVCIRHVALDTRVLQKLAACQIAFVTLNTRRSDHCALLLGKGHNDGQLRLLQYQLVQDKAWCLEFSQQLIAAKLKAQIRLLERMLLVKPAQRYALTQAQEDITLLLQSLNQVTTSDQLLGCEGFAAKTFFQAYAVMFSGEFEFSGRKRRPPPDPVNAVLSLAYTLLHKRMEQWLYARGLEPLLGFYHVPVFKRASLASDLIEVWRPHIDEWVWQLFSKQVLRPHHFYSMQHQCQLTKEGGKLFFPKFESMMKVLSRAIRLQVQVLVRTLRDEGKSRGK